MSAREGRAPTGPVVVSFQKLSPGQVYLGEFVPSQKLLSYLSIGETENMWKLDSKRSFRSGRKLNHTGQKHGCGKIVNAYKDVTYLGELKQGVIDGYGIMRNSQNQTITRGFWRRNGLGLHGFGEIKDLLTNETYMGFFQNGKKDGTGVESSFSKNVSFYGSWKKGLKNGIGCIYKNKKMVYLGAFESGLKTGFCHCELGDEQHYDGMLFKGDRHGIGRMVSSNSENCSNQSQNQSNETCYTGQYQSDQKHGFGRLETPEMIYVGGWHKNLRHGIGYQKQFGAESYYGSWKNGNRSGLGYETCEDREYKGEFLDDLYHGYAIVKAPNRKPVHAYFEKGKLIDLVEPSNPNILRIQQFKLDIDNFFQKSKKKLVEFDYFIENNKKRLENSVNFQLLRDTIEKNSLDLDRRLQDIKFKFQEMVDKFEILYSKLELMAGECALNLEIEDKFVSLDTVRVLQNTLKLLSLNFDITLDFVRLGRL